jgi:hypothetical protein
LVIIESTANGYNDFHTLWRKSESGKNDFMPVFLPWSLDPDYRRVVDADFVLDADENKIAELHGLDKEQMAWRRAKIAVIAFVPKCFLIFFVGDFCAINLERSDNLKGISHVHIRRFGAQYPSMV